VTAKSVKVFFVLYFAGICELFFTLVIVLSSTYLLLHHTLRGMVTFHSDFFISCFVFKYDIWNSSAGMLCISFVKIVVADCHDCRIIHSNVRTFLVMKFKLSLSLKKHKAPQNTEGLSNGYVQFNCCRKHDRERHVFSLLRN